MKIFDLNTDFNKVSTKEELVKSLNAYRGILSDSAIDYLNSLIELEFSVIRDYISTDDRVALSELEVYKKIAIYNIYNRAFNIFRNEGKDFRILGNEDGWECLEVSALVKDRSVKLFSFSYCEGPLGFNESIPSGYKTMRIGDIQLFKTLESKELREAELSRVMEELERLYDAKNPYPYRPNIYGGPGATWIFNHDEKIKNLEERFKQLDSKRELSDEDKKEIEISRHIHELLLDDYGLTSESFTDEVSQPFAEKAEIVRTRVKKMPNICIKDNIKFI